MMKKILPFVAFAILARGSVSSLSAQAPGPKPAASAASPAEPIDLLVGRSKVIQAPWKVKRASVTDPQVADIQVLTPEQVLLIGKSVGSTDVILWNEAEETWQARVEVDEDMPRIQEQISKLFPQSALDVSRTRDGIVVTGRHARAEHADQLRRYLETSGYKFVDMTTVPGIHQVQIQVRVAEVSRNALRAMGINGFQTGNHFFGASTVGTSSGGAINPINIGPPAGAAAGEGVPFLFNSPVNVSPLVTLFTGFPDADLQIFIQALAENQYLRILAEPNLVALSGEEANFLAGGEYPIPVIQGGTSSNTSVTIEYKEFGVKLRFRPTVLGEGTIRILVAPEISDLSDVGAVEIQGFRIPSLLTRRAETTLELQSGQTFAMAGLLDRRSASRISKVPFLGSLPIIGALFRSVRYQSGETEMVVLVTASLVEPVSAGKTPPVPGATHLTPNDWELYGLGRSEGKRPSRPPQPLVPVVDMGLDRLKGPGAWADHESPGQRSRSTVK